MGVKYSSFVYKLRPVIGLLVSILIIGTLGFHFIERWNFLDSFYMTLITITTIGYGEVHPLSTLGRVFDICVILLGVGTAAYAFAEIAGFIVGGELRDLLGKRRLNKEISKMKDHYIICGNGRIGALVWSELRANKKPFVVVDSNPSALESLLTENLPCIIGDATREQTLIDAGIEKAKGLIATATSDVTNVYITLISRNLKPDIFILARAETEDSIKNLKRAGADKVISPYILGGRHMANLLLKPAVVDFIELAAGLRVGINMEEFRVEQGSEVEGKSLVDSPIRKNLGLMVVAIKRADGDMVFNPSAEYILEKDDILICMGDKEAFGSLRRLVSR